MGRKVKQIWRVKLPSCRIRVRKYYIDCGLKSPRLDRMVQMMPNQETAFVQPLGTGPGKHASSKAPHFQSRRRIFTSPIRHSLALTNGSRVWEGGFNSRLDIFSVFADCLIYCLLHLLCYCHSQLFSCFDFSSYISLVDGRFWGVQLRLRKLRVQYFHKLKTTQLGCHLRYKVCIWWLRNKHVKDY